LLVVCVSIASIASLASIARAEGPRQIAWEDLAVQLAPAANPFAGLPAELVEALAEVAGARTRRGLGVKLSARELDAERDAASKLRKADLDVEALLAKRDAMAEKQRALANAVNPALDGTLVRLPGYLLPLEFDGKKVTEFLLVPWVGACIHTPPPPPNQIVHVKSGRPFEVASTFEAVWVTGRIAVNSTRKAVFITDGASDVDVGYAIRADRVERY
jgi:hypothetical protein